MDKLLRISIVERSLASVFITIDVAEGDVAVAIPKVLDDFGG